MSIPATQGQAKADISVLRSMAMRAVTDVGPGGVGSMVLPRRHTRLERALRILLRLRYDVTAQGWTEGEALDAFMDSGAMVEGITRIDQRSFRITFVVPASTVSDVDRSGVKRIGSSAGDPDPVKRG